MGAQQKAAFSPRHGMYFRGTRNVRLELPVQMKCTSKGELQI